MDVLEHQLQEAAPVAPFAREDEAFTPEERALLAFFSIEGIGPAKFAILRQRFGSLWAALCAPRKEVAAALPDRLAREKFLACDDPLALADRHLERARRLGARVLFPSRPGWPRQLEGCDLPPLLYVRGTLPEASRAIAIVGSRTSDEYGLEFATFFSSGFARAGVTVVSGGARGIDSVAHETAMENGGKTVAVVGTGIDLSYPGENAKLFDRIVERGGAVVTHFPPGTPGNKPNFIVRNKVIAALSDAVLVARAREGSGAISTALAGHELGRPVFVVPGDVTSDYSTGGNALFGHPGVFPAGDFKAIAQRLGWAPRDPVEKKVKAPPRPTVRSESNRTLEIPLPPKKVEVPNELMPVWQALGGEAVQFDELLQICGLDAARLADALLRLEVMGLVVEQLGRRFARNPALRIG